jgi:hypothetical protein
MEETSELIDLGINYVCEKILIHFYAKENNYLLAFYEKI